VCGVYTDINKFRSRSVEPGPRSPKLTLKLRREFETPVHRGPSKILHNALRGVQSSLVKD
jgi:hypothetical protein